MRSRSVRFFLFLMIACMAVITTAGELKVFRGTLVHSRVRIEMEVLEDYLIGFDENNLGRIVFVRPATELESLAQQWSFNQNDVVNLTASQFLMPGLVDCHFNAPQYFRAGTTVSTFFDILVNTLAPGELMFRNVTYAREVSKEVVTYTLRSGATTVGYYGSASVESNIELARVIGEFGQRASIYHFALDTVPPGFEEVARTIEENVNFSRRFSDYIRELENPLIQASIGPEETVTNSPELVRALGALIANTSDVLVQTRFAQLAPEDITTLPEREAAGVLPVNRTMIIYSTNVRDSELETYRRRGISIAHCPYYDLNLNAGILDVRRILNLGITVGLGTSVPFGQSTSVLTEMRTAILASRALRLNLTMDLPADYTPLTLAEGFYMATMGGAEALGLGDTVGNFEVGKQFDAILVDTSVPSPVATSSLDTTNVRIEKFLYLGDDRNILKVFVAGKLRSSRDGLPTGLPLQILLVNNSPRIVGGSVTVDLNVSKPTQSLICHLRGVSGVGRKFSNEQDCSSLNIVYPNLNAGKYVFRVVGNAVTGESAVIRREFKIGGSGGDCTVNLINRGIVVTDDMATIQFAGNGDASSHTCRMDQQHSHQCESPVVYSGLSSGEHRFQVSPHGCTAGSSFRMRAKFTVP